MDLGLSNKIVLVTGASGGIGSELVRQFAKQNCKVAIHFNRNREPAEKLLNAIGSKRAVLAQADLTVESDVSRMWGEIREQLGPVDILLANAGICLSYGKPIHHISLADWNRTLAGNLTSVFLCIREFFRDIERFKMTDPAAVLIGSTAGQFGEAFNADYSASKSPLSSGFLLSLKNEIARLSPRGRVNAVCPSWTVTDMVEDQLADTKHVSKVLQTVALRKVARPLDVANAALYLASAAAGHCTGQVITVAGGMEGRVLYTPDEIDFEKI